MEFAKSIDTKKGSAKANWDQTYPNSKFEPMSTKLEGQIEIYYKPQVFPKKLTDKKQITIARNNNIKVAVG